MEKEGIESKQQYRYVCEDTVDAIFTAIYLAWEKGTTVTSIEIEGEEDTPSFFYQYIHVKTDAQLASKVATSIRKKLSLEIYTAVFRTALSNEHGKAELIYRFLVKAFRVGPQIIHQLQDDDVNKVTVIGRKVGSEAHKYLGFVRFEERNNGILVARINPLANVVPLIADHFQDRLHNENWIILDTVRNISAIHSKGQNYVLSKEITENMLLEMSTLSDKEQEYQKLWKQFFHTIAIKERENTKLQQNMMPLRYRKYM